jgi:hypothetical protein
MNRKVAETQRFDNAKFSNTYIEFMCEKIFIPKKSNIFCDFAA